MDNKNINSKIILLLAVFGLIGLAIVLLIAGNNSDANNNTNTANSQLFNNHIEDDDDEVINSNMKIVKNYTTYFTAMDIINNLYSDVQLGDTEAILDKLDSKYVRDNGITSDNVISKISVGSSDYNYEIKDFYYKNIQNNDCYFVTGNLNKYGEYKEFANSYIMSFLIMTDGKSYSIRPLPHSDDFKKYVSEYTFTKIELKSNKSNEYKKHSMSELDVLTFYIAYYANLAIDNPAKAYAMLDSSMISKYSTQEAFVSDLDNIISIFGNDIYGYKTEGESGNMTFKADMYGSHKIIIVEDSIMNFKIKF